MPWRWTFPPWAIKAINKILRGYLWRGRKEANGGHCLIAWPKVTRPKSGISLADIKSLNHALRVRWLWLKKSDPSKPWANLPMQANQCMQALCSMAVATEVGDGTNTLFWTDRWILGKCIEEVCPLIHSMVPKRIANKKTVAEALSMMSWIRDIHGVASFKVFEEFLMLWDLVTEITLQPEVSDKHIWRLSSTGKYWAQSAYEALFQGAVQFEPWKHIWRPGLRGSVGFFYC